MTTNTIPAVIHKGISENKSLHNPQEIKNQQITYLALGCIASIAALLLCRPPQSFIFAGVCLLLSIAETISLESKEQPSLEVKTDPTPYILYKNPFYKDSIRSVYHKTIPLQERPEFQFPRILTSPPTRYQISNNDFRERVPQVHTNRYHRWPARLDEVPTLNNREIVEDPHRHEQQRPFQQTANRSFGSSWNRPIHPNFPSFHPYSLTNRHIVRDEQRQT